MPHTIRFDDYEVDLPAGQLYKHGAKISLRDKSFQVLAALLEHPGEVVTRAELQHRLWHKEVFVDFDNNLNTVVARLREALGDSAEHPHFIETLPKHGYRLIVPVAPHEEASPVEALQVHPLPVRRRVLNLRNSAIGVALLVILSAGAFWIWHSRHAAARTPKRVMLAVLPFINLTGSADQDYLSDGLTEEIITELARLDPARVGVIARSSVMKYKGASPDVREVGRRLGVDYVLEGALRSAPQRLGVTVQLIRVSDQTHLWAQEYNPSPGDPLSLEYSVAEHTAGALQMQLLPSAQKRLSEAHSIKPEAQEAYLRGRYILSHANATAFEQALQYFQKAVEDEPDYAEAYAGIADAYILLGNYGILQRMEAEPKAKAAALKAIALDNSLTEARRALADIRWEYELDFAGAGEDFRRAIADNANDAGAHQWYASYLCSMGEFDEAIREMRKARELNPLSLHVGVDMGRAYYFARQYDLAIAEFRKVIELDPNFARVHSQLGMALVEKGQYEEALAELRTGIALAGGQSSWLGHAYARAGKLAEAKKELAGQLEQWNKSHTEAFGIALTYVGLGDKDQAFAWLDRDLEVHGAVYMIKAYPCMDPLRSDPRFAMLLRKMNLEP